MLIKLDSLTEGHTYEIDRLMDIDSSVEKLVNAVIISKILLQLKYVWSDNQLHIMVSSQYTICAHCDLCFVMTDTQCNCSLQEVLTQQNTEYLKAENAFDVGSIINECIVLALAREVKCSADCKGLCASCGKNLNLYSCNCEKTREDINPFGVLKDLFLTGGAKNGSTKKKNI